jgi:ribosomal protein L31
MKSQYHLLKQKKRIQLTDGSIFFLDIFSEVSILKLSLDPKSHILWKEKSNFEISKNSVSLFMKKFNFFGKKSQ